MPINELVGSSPPFEMHSIVIAIQGINREGTKNAPKIDTYTLHTRDQRYTKIDERQGVRKKIEVVP